MMIMGILVLDLAVLRTYYIIITPVIGTSKSSLSSVNAALNIILKILQNF